MAVSRGIRANNRILPIIKTAITIPATQSVKVFQSKRNVVNSGYRVFYNKVALFDSKDGLIGFK